MSKPGQFLLYTAPDGAVKVDVFIQQETVWLTQKALAELFGVKVPAVNKHLKNIFDSGELIENSVVSILETTAADSKNYSTRYYNLDAIIAVGYRVNSYQATQFRIWATKTLREFIIKGFVLDDERLKQGKQVFGRDYFDELLERIREIRASERRFYQKITDIYSLAVDYSADAPQSKEFFAAVQNKLHWAITGQTAAEIIYARADAAKIYMGLTTWRHAPGGKILKSDVTVAKNYLSEAHVKELNRIMSAYLDLAENRAQRGIVTKMADWVKFLHDFLTLSNYPILQNKGKVSALEAKLKAEGEYEVYRKRQDAEYISDFDREIKRIEGKNLEPAASPMYAAPTERQGQFLAYIFQYSLVQGCAPAEADMQRYFQITPPSAHSMVLTLERRGFIRRVPGQARSITLTIRPESLPPLKRIHR